MDDVAARRGARGGGLSQVAYDHIRQAIFDCRYAAGDHLRERDIAAELDVSRVPIREALPRLETAGLIRIDGRRGAVVTHITAEDVEELYNLRGVLEPLAAQTAAERASAADSLLLQQDLMNAAKALDSQDYRALDMFNREIHQRIVNMSGSALLARTLTPLDDRLRRLASVTVSAEPDVRHHEHTVLVSAIATGNPALAASAAFTHVELGRIRTVAALETHPHFRPGQPTPPRRRRKG